VVSSGFLGEGEAVKVFLESVSFMQCAQTAKKRYDQSHYDQKMSHVSIDSFSERLLYFRSCWIVFDRTIWGRPRGLLQLKKLLPAYYPQPPISSLWTSHGFLKMPTTRGDDRPDIRTKQWRLHATTRQQRVPCTDVCEQCLVRRRGDPERQRELTCLDHRRRMAEPLEADHRDRRATYDLNSTPPNTLDTTAWLQLPSAQSAILRQFLRSSLESSR